jgi:uncharacterized protein YciI
MYVIELEFDDNPLRLAARPTHRERLLELHTSGRLVMAGPWSDDSGAMLVFRTDRDGLDEILAADPYYTTPGVRIKVVRQWNPITGE